MSQITPVTLVEIHLQESHVSEAFRCPPFFFPSEGERVHHATTLGLRICHTTHGGCFHVTMFNYLPSVHRDRQGKAKLREEGGYVKGW